MSGTCTAKTTPLMSSRFYSHLNLWGPPVGMPSWPKGRRSPWRPAAACAYIEFIGKLRWGMLSSSLKSAPCCLSSPQWIHRPGVTMGTRLDCRMALLYFRFSTRSRHSVHPALYCPPSSRPPVETTFRCLKLTFGLSDGVFASVSLQPVSSPSCWLVSRWSTVYLDNKCVCQ